MHAGTGIPRCDTLTAGRGESRGPVVYVPPIRVEAVEDVWVASWMARDPRVAPATGTGSAFLPCVLVTTASSRSHSLIVPSEPADTRSQGGTPLVPRAPPPTKRSERMLPAWALTSAYGAEADADALRGKGAPVA